MLKNNLNKFLLILFLIAGVYPLAYGFFHQDNGIFSQWDNIKPNLEIKSALRTTSEIWPRVRDQLDISAPKSKPAMQKQLKKLSNSPDHVQEIMENASPYLFFILEEVEKRGMPSEIALIPMIESTFDPHAVSNKGAVGLWQIMPGTGKILGLKRNDWSDDRKDIYESTRAALDHLEYLHKRFNGNWLHALAAYNSGEVPVLKAIKKNKSAKKPTDFWSLSLPKQTTDYVPKILAVAAVIQSPKTYGIELPKIPNKPVFKRIETSKPITISHAAKLAKVPETRLKELNPGLKKKSMNPKGPYRIVVPIQRAKMFEDKV